MEEEKKEEEVSCGAKKKNEMRTLVSFEKEGWDVIGQDRFDEIK